MILGDVPMPVNLVPMDLAHALRDGGDSWPAQAVTRFRDLLLTRHGDLITVIACDSNAGIGDQPADVLRQSARNTGYAAAKVPLMEVLAAGAAPVVLVNALGSDRRGAGRDVVAGIEDCIRLSGHRPVVTGSDETNIVTVQSSVGVTVIGVTTADRLRLGRARPGDDVVVVGRPMDGLQVPYDERDPTVVTPREVAALVASALVHEVLPVGSRGVQAEAGELARTAGLVFEEHPGDIDLAISAGSSTCVLVACRPEHTRQIAQLVPQTTTIIGRLR